MWCSLFAFREDSPFAPLSPIFYMRLRRFQHAQPLTGFISNAFVIIFLPSLTCLLVSQHMNLIFYYFFILSSVFACVAKRGFLLSPITCPINFISNLQQKKKAMIGDIMLYLKQKSCRKTVSKAVDYINLRSPVVVAYYLKPRRLHRGVPQSM